MSKKRMFIFVSISAIFSLIVFPIIFNFLFMWESGYARGETGDWFTFYGNIVGSLIGGIFTYVALVFTFETDKEKVHKEKIYHIKETILTWKEHIDEIEGYIYQIKGLFNEDEINLMDDDYKIQFKTQYGIEIFDGNITPKGIQTYKDTLDLLFDQSKDLKDFLKDRYIQLKEFDDKELTDFLLDSYHAIINYNEYIGRHIDNDEVLEREFVYSFVNNYENVGYKGVISTVSIKIYRVFYLKYIDDNFVGEIIRNNYHPHIRG